MKALQDFFRDYIDTLVFFILKHEPRKKMFTHPVCSCCIVNLLRECVEEYKLCNIKMLYIFIFNDF